MHRHTAVAGFLIAVGGALPLVCPTDVDLDWHLSAGRWIAEHGFPRVDPFSFTVAGRPWVDHEWLGQTWMYALNMRFGYPALTVLFGLVTAITLALTHAEARRRGAGRIPALLVVFVLSLAIAPTGGVRPQNFGPLFVALFCTLLSPSAPLSVRRACGLAGLLMLLWVNLHGSFILGVGLIGLSILAAAIGKDGDRRLQRRRWAMLAAALLASLCNPYGIELWLLPLDYVAVGSNSMRAIMEWQPVALASVSGAMLLLTLGPLLLLGAPRRLTGDLESAARIAVFAPLPLLAVYHLPTTAVVLLPIVAQRLGERWPALAQPADESVDATTGRLNRRLLLASIAVTWLAASWLPQAQTGRAPRRDGKVTYPAAAVDVLAGLPADIRLFNAFEWGGYLITRLYPRQRVFIDSRVDPYRGEVFEDFLSIVNLRAGWQERLARYRVDTVLIQNGSALDAALAHETGWHCLYRDALAAVHHRTAPLAVAPVTTGVGDAAAVPPAR